MDARTRGLSFAGLYYEGALAGLDDAAAVFLSWHTETDPADPINGFKRLIAYMGNRDGALIDRVASGMFWPSFLTRAEAVALAAQVGVRLERERPASAVLVGQLTRDVVGVETIVPEFARFLAVGDGQASSVTFEALEPLVSVENDFRGFDVDSGSGGVVTYESASDVYSERQPVAASFLAWPGEDLGDALYIGHPTLAFTSVDVAISGGVSKDCAWEIYDPTFTFAPGPNEGGTSAAVYAVGDGTIRLRLEDYANGTRLDDGVFSVVVTCLLTGQTERCEVVNHVTRGAEITTTTTLGQGTPSTETSDYTIQPGWVIPIGLDDGTSGLSATGTVAFDLPIAYRFEGETVERRWEPTTVDGQEAYWLRCRRTGVAAAGSSTVTGITPVSAADGAWWAVFGVVQGVSESAVVGTSDGTAWQRVEVPVTDPIEGSIGVAVDDVEWTVVPSLYATGPTDRAAMIWEDPDGRIWVRFGDGITTAAAPTAGAEIRVDYRRGATESGNVGPETIRLSSNPSVPLQNVSNPRMATGWAIREGGTAEDLERVRVTVPSTLRVGARIVTHEDAQHHAARWTTADGRQPVARAEAGESLEDPDGIAVYAIGTDGYPLAEADRQALEYEINGRRIGLQRVGGLVLANVVASVRGIRLRTVNVAVTVYVLPGYSAGVEAAVKAALRAYLWPLAVRGQVVSSEPSIVMQGATRGSPATWVHRLGGYVSKYAVGAVVNAAVGSAMSDVSVSFTGEVDPSAAVAMESDQLPIAGTIAVTVVEAS